MVQNSKTSFVTSAVDSHNVRQTALLVAAVMPQLRWRVHGIGLLQAYLVESDPEIRVHVWHESILGKPGISDSGAVHDHRFQLDSTVLYGEVRHDDYTLSPYIHGEWCKWTVPNARSVDGQRPDSHVLTQMGAQRYHAEVRRRSIPAGTRYTFAPWLFHRASADPLTVTIVTKHMQDTGAQATILAPYGTTPEHAFKWSVPDEVVGSVVRQAQSKLTTMYRGTL